MKVAKIGLAEIDKHPTDAQRAEVITPSESETRSMTISKRF